MPSENARATTAAESRFRIDDPNSQPRSTRVIALDAASEPMVKRLAQSAWRGATFLTSRALDPPPQRPPNWSMQGWLSDLAGRAKDLIDEIATADLVIMVAAAGAVPPTASVIAEAARLRGVMTTALVLDAQSASDEFLARTLAALRPHVSMLVVANGEDYVEAMLAALRA